MCMYPCVIVLFDRVNIIQDKTRQASCSFLYFLLTMNLSPAAKKAKIHPDTPRPDTTRPDARQHVQTAMKFVMAKESRKRDRELNDFGTCFSQSTPASATSADASRTRTQSPFPPTTSLLTTMPPPQQIVGLGLPPQGPPEYRRALIPRSNTVCN